jgi:serine/threonine-protein kinase
MLTGRPPFSGESVAAILHQQANADPQPPRDADRRIPAALTELVMQMLAKQPEDRPQSAAEVRKRLPDAGMSEPRGHATRTVSTSRLRRNASQKRAADALAKHRRVAATAALASVALVLVAIALLSSGGSPHSTPAASRHSTASKRTADTSHLGSNAADTTPTGTTSSVPAATTSTPTTGSAPPALTVAGIAGALTTLLAHDVEAASVGQPAAQHITDELANILNAYETGHTTNLPHELANLAQQVTMLESHGEISAAAVPQLQGDLTNLETALTAADPETHTDAGPQQGNSEEPGADETELEAPDNEHHGHHLKGRHH